MNNQRLLTMNNQNEYLISLSQAEIQCLTRITRSQIGKHPFADEALDFLKTDFLHRMVIEVKYLPRFIKEAKKSWFNPEWWCFEDSVDPNADDFSPSTLGLISEQLYDKIWNQANEYNKHSLIVPVDVMGLLGDGSYNQEVISVGHLVPDFQDGRFIYYRPTLAQTILMHEYMDRFPTCSYVFVARDSFRGRLVELIDLLKTECEVRNVK